MSSNPAPRIGHFRGGPSSLALFPLTSLLFALMMAVTGSPAAAQDSGALVVQVESGEGVPLAGAVIQVTPGERSALTGERGEARISNLPPGRYEVSVSLMGHASVTTAVEVEAGTTASLPVTLVQEAIILEGLVVRGQTGQAEAFNRQRVAANIRNVISSEHVERFPDTNTSDVLRRMPGVAAQDDRGETGLLFLRGLSPAFTSVSMDGQRVPSTTRTDRGTSLSGVPAEMLGSMEVIKALTPDMDADAIAGSINLQPRRPTSRQIDGRIEGGLHSIASGGTGRGALTWADRVGDLGVVLSGDFSRQDRATEALAYDWTNLGSGRLEESHLDRLRIQSYPIERTRYGLSGQLEQRFSPSSSLFLRGFVTRYDTREERHRITYRLDAGDRLSPEEIVGGRVEREGREYLRQRHIYSLTGGGEREFGAFRVDAQLGWTRADRTEPYRDYYEYRLSGVDMRGTAEDRFRPRVQLLNGNDLDPQAFQLRHFDQRTDDMRDGSWTGSFNLERAWSPGPASGTLRFGARATRRTKDRDYNERRWGSFPGSFHMGEIGSREKGRRILGDYDFGPIVDWNRAGPWWQDNGSIFSFNESDSREDSDSEDYSAREDVLAAYGMTTLDVGNLQVLAGLRLEHTSSAFEGQRLVFDAQGDWQETLPVDGSSRYTDLFPSLHLRYRLDQNTNLRFAATTAIARPGFLDLAPNEFINFEDQQISRGNPGLGPARSINLDVMAERYFLSGGVLSGGVFLKRIDDFIYGSRTTLADGEFAGFELFEPLAGDRAEVWGFEVNWQQRLDFLPGALAGLGAFVNYAYTGSQTDLGPGADRDLPLPEQVPHIVNAALSYEAGGFVGVVSFNHQHAYVRNAGSGPLTDEFKASRQQIDLSAHQRITPNLRLFVQMNNVFDEPYVRYIGSSAFPDSSDYHGRWGAIGLRFNY